jgi:hypothetical protein
MWLFTQLVELFLIFLAIGFVVCLGYALLLIGQAILHLPFQAFKWGLKALGVDAPQPGSVLAQDAAKHSKPPTP